MALLFKSTITVALLGVALGAGFGCNNPDMDDSARHMFLNGHNEPRLNMARGLEPNKCGNLPSGKNIYKVDWSCKLEEAAAKYLRDNNCPSGFAPAADLAGLGTVAQNIQWNGGSFPNPAQSAAANVEKWWGSVRTVGFTDPDNKYQSSLYTWSNMANGKLSKIGCAYLVCGGNTMSTLCFYNEVGYITGMVVYEPGTPCASDSECTTFPQSTCAGELCVKKPEAEDTTSNTVCPTNPEMTDAIRDKFIEMHNYLRSRGARGLEPDAIPGGGYAPQASKMLKMEYDCALEETSQSWANACNYAHSANADRVHGGVQSGENMYMTSNNAQDKIAAATASSQLWWDELKDYGLGPENWLNTTNFYRTAPAQIGHYTQMAWDRTFKLGCGVKHCPSMTFVVCQYNPAGNYMNGVVYSMGTPCSACPATHPVCEDGLCAKS